jgi:hypothetical protein
MNIEMTQQMSVNKYWWKKMLWPLCWPKTVLLIYCRPSVIDTRCVDQYGVSLMLQLITLQTELIDFT